MCNKLVLLLLLFTTNVYALTWDEAFNTVSNITISTSTNPNDTLDKTSGGNNTFDSMLRTQENITSGDGFMEVEIKVIGTRFPAFGLTNKALLANGTLNQTALNIANDFGATQVASQFLGYIQNGSAITIAGVTLSVGDKVRVEVVGPDVVIKHNGTIVHTFATPVINYPLHGIAYFRNVGEGFTNILVDATSPPAGSFLPIPTPATPPPKAITSKGGILTKDANSQRIEFPACANGKILGFNSTTATGLDCLDNL